jgi:hypothetical protein
LAKDSEFLNNPNNSTFNSVIIFTTARWDQIQLTENWIRHALLQGFDNFFVAALDRQSFEYLQSKNIPTILEEVDSKLGDSEYQRKVDDEDHHHQEALLQPEECPLC